jgi:sterol 14-demethylase
MQIKAVFSVLLREWEFEMAQPADTYRNDHSKMAVQLQRPAVEDALLQAGKAMS